jgi:hypothetical protein
VLKALVNAAKHNQSACDPGWRRSWAQRLSSQMCTLL